MVKKVAVQRPPEGGGAAQQSPEAMFKPIPRTDTQSEGEGPKPVPKQVIRPVPKQADNEGVN